MTGTSSFQQADDVSGSERETVENETDAAKLEDTSKDGGIVMSEEDIKRLKEKALLVDSDSDSSADGAISLDLRSKISRVDSQKIFEGCNAKMKRKTEKKDRKNQGSNLVKGLVDYLKALEDRIDKLQSVPPDTEAKVDKGKDSSISPTEGGDSIIEVGVKFFNSAAYLTKDGAYPGADDKTEKGTFMCDHDTQHPIRVLYSKVKGDVAEVTKQADSENPTCNDIDILTFAVSSEAIALFFAKQLDIDAEDDNLIRFRNPFRPTIRHLNPVREQLKLLESHCE